MQLTNNLDPSQAVPDDQLQVMLRHVRVQVLKIADATSSVPYLSPSVDVLLDSHPVLSNVPLEPMLSAESTTPDMYYGNNIKVS